MTTRTEQHTPTPWHLDEFDLVAPLGDGLQSIAVFPSGKDIPYLNEGQIAGVEAKSKANAAFAVRAVNAHEALVQALRLAEFQPCKPHDNCGTHACEFHSVVEAALALAEGK